MPSCPLSLYGTSLQQRRAKLYQRLFRAKVTRYLCTPPHPITIVTVVHSSPSHRYRHCRALLPIPSLSSLSCTPPHPIAIITVVHSSPSHRYHHCCALLPIPSLSSLSCTPPHPIAITTVVHSSPSQRFRAASREVSSNQSLLKIPHPQKRITR